MAKNNRNSLLDKSRGACLNKADEKPNIKFNHERKKKVGPIRYRSTKNRRDRVGNRSVKKEKNKNSAIKNIEPGKPKKIKLFSRITRKSFGHKKFNPLISVISRVLKRRATASTNKNEFVESNAWLINIQKLANNKLE
jgi:hypothetical protein